MDESDWDPFKAEIHRIYIKENRTLKELRQFMIRTCGFRKSNYQYQAKLKQWGFKKYRMGAKKWIYVKRQIEKRNKLEKASEVFIDGVQCPRNVVQAEIRRQGFETAMEIYNTALSPRTPDGVIVCTPGLVTPQLWSPNLPWFTFSQTIFRDIEKYLLPLRESVSHLSLPPIDEGGSHRGLASKSITIGLSSLLAGKAADGLQASERSSRMAAVLTSIMPEEHADQNMHLSNCLCGIGDEAALTGVLRVALFLMSNNLLVAATSASETEIRNEDTMIMAVFHLGGLSTLQNMRYLLSVPSATAHAISLKLWASAVRTQDLEAVQLLLKAGINPDTRVLFEDDPVWPLEIAAQSHDTTIALEMSRSLFSHNACSKNHQALESALYHATEAQNKALMELLLLRGAYVSCCALRAAIRRDTPDLLEVLLTADSDVNKICGHVARGKDYSNSILGIAVIHNNVPFARRLLSLGAKVDAYQNFSFPDDIFDKRRSTTLGLAIIQPRYHIFKSLLAAGADINHKTNEHGYIPPLVLAVESGSLRITLDLLKSGADVALGDATGKITLVDRALARGHQRLSNVLIANGARADTSSMQNHYSAMLMQKVAVNDLETVTLLINCGARVNDTYQQTPDTVFAAAVHQGNCKILEILLRAGAVNTGKTLVSIGNVETARYLEQRGMLSDILLSNGEAILANAIRYNNSDLVQFLMDRGADQHREIIGRKDSRSPEENSPGIPIIRTTPLGGATRQRNFWLADTLVKRGASITDLELYEATSRCNVDKDPTFLNLFLHALDGRACAAPCSYAHAIEGPISSVLVNRFLEVGLDPRGQITVPTVIPKRCRTPSPMSVLDLTVLSGKRELFCSLLNSRKWDSQAKGNALAMCIEGRCNDLVPKLLDAGADVNYQGKMGERYVTPLVIAVQAQDVSIIHSLLEAGADIDWTPSETSSGEDFSILQHAVSTKNKQIVETLIQAGADVNAPASWHHGKTALQNAVFNRNMELIDVLLISGANTNQGPAQVAGATALQFASILGYIEIAHKLLTEGAEVDAARALFCGRTALEGAAEYGHIDMLQLLLNEGASVHGAGREQYIRAVNLAESRTHYAAAELLKNFGGWDEEDARPVIWEDFWRSGIAREEQAGEDVIIEKV